MIRKNEYLYHHSNIKGYHIFKLRPHPSVGMIVEEVANSYDPNAMVAVMPRLNNIDPALYNEVCCEARKGMRAQMVRLNAGKIIGRVPANIGKIFRDLLKNADVKKSHACQ